MYLSSTATLAHIMVAWADFSRQPSPTPDNCAACNTGLLNFFCLKPYIKMGTGISTECSINTYPNVVNSQVVVFLSSKNPLGNVHCSSSDILIWLSITSQPARKWPWQATQFNAGIPLQTHQLTNVNNTKSLTLVPGFVLSFTWLTVLTTDCSRF